MNVQGLAQSLGCRLVEAIEKGWSGDRKFLLEDGAGERFVLRLSAKQEEQKKRREFERVRQLDAMGLPVSRAVAFGCREDAVYQLLGWVEGCDLRQTLPALPEDEQYRLGVQASRVLRKIHTLPLRPGEGRGREEQQQKILSRLDQYEQGQLRLPGDERPLRFAREQVGLVGQRPPVWCHGDFHAGNLIYTPRGEAAVIDFNRMRPVDPYEEFYKVELFDAEDSVPFAAGRIDGYFDGEIPPAFWQVQKVYVAYTILYSLLWAAPFGQGEVDGMRARYERSMRAYDNFEREVPRWYEDYKKR